MQIDKNDLIKSLEELELYLRDLETLWKICEKGYPLFEKKFRKVKKRLSIFLKHFLYTYGAEKITLFYQKISGFILCMEDENNEFDTCVNPGLQQLQEQFPQKLYLGMMNVLPAELERLKRIYTNMQKSLKSFLKVDNLLESESSFVDTDSILDIQNLSSSYPCFNVFPTIVYILKNNQQLLEDISKEANQKKIYTEEELKGIKRQQYIDKYSLRVNNTVTLEDIEEVLCNASSLGLSYFQQYPEVFGSKKSLFLANLNILFKKKIPFAVVLDRDPNAFLCVDLEDRIFLIEQYGVSVEEILFYQEKAITDLSYFMIFDLMIERGYFNLKELLDSNCVDLKKRISMHLLGLPTGLFFNKNFPLTEEEVNHLLKRHFTTSLNRMNIMQDSILDQYKIDQRTYSLNGVFVSRPKVLRNMENGITVDTILCNSYFTDLEQELLQSFVIESLSQINKKYQKR